MSEKQPDANEKEELGNILNQHAPTIRNLINPKPEVEEPSKRRRDFLLKLDVLRKQYPNIEVPKVTAETSDDQLEIIYLKCVKKIETEEKAKERNNFGKMIGDFMPMIMNMFSERNTKPKESDKPDFVVHHIIKFEK